MSSTQDDLTRCDRCIGRKTIIGIGMMEKQCPNCFGIGWTAKTAIEIKKPILDEMPVKQKPGRKPAIKSKDVLNCGAE